MGIGGSYLETDDTLANYREHLWIPGILNRRAREECPGPLGDAVRDALAVLHTLLSKPDEALELLERGKALLPSSPTVTYRLAVAHATI